MTEARVARRVEINGIVQGVGFRPFVYQLAHHYQLKGEVANTSSGVAIHIEGPQANVESFSKDLVPKCPPLAHITEVSFYFEHIKDFKDFTIVDSRHQALMTTLISPDVATCDDCRRELLDANDRRFKYPFINCTNCGPRYTIIDDVPYDRPKTSMKHFTMCAPCQAEYDDPADRRFHAQPNACETCGPHLDLYDNTRQKVSTPRPLEKTAALLNQGCIIAVKGLGGFHLAVDAENDQAVEALRKRKLREEKPMALMSYDIESIRRFAHIEPDEEDLLTSPQRPIVLLRKKKPNSISKAVAPRNRYFGVLLPYTPLHYLLLSYGFTALVMTSGNLSEEPIAIDNHDAFERLADIADYFLIHNRNIYLRSDDSIARKTAGTTRFIRRSRGYVPAPVFLNKKVPPILACGAELKNTVCLTKDNKAFLSQHIGDLENLATYDFFQLTIRHMQRILDIQPEIIAFDLHPDYLSTRYAEQQEGILKIRVQHHHAHIISVMAENRIDGPVIGLALDGTGFGSDGAIWGGEILIADHQTYSRAAHFAYVPMPGSAAAIKEPWRMAISYLYDAFGDEFQDLDLPLLKAIDSKKITIMADLIKKRLNAPLTSSLGRLFDGIAAIAGIRYKIAFEGQAAMELEMLADNKETDIYDYEWTVADRHIILTRPIIKGVVQDMLQGVHSSVISGKFHQTLIRMFSELCEVIRKQSGLNRVLLSGGVFQNSLLLTGLIRTLEMNKFKVFSHTQVPTNDGGICLGQALVAAAVANKI
uniref:Carbamoyltransferase n=1 Tax=Candidatus Desulfatibia profunda TaxID=2841695 RepID=A0A8J6NTT7_9BACT|nr:carbamoyltransferase HypF [Candidatus Desulfatibia profunda]